VSPPVRQQSRKPSDECTIGRTKPRALLLTSENREPVAQQRQLRILGELGPTTTNEQPQNCGKGEVDEREEH
jgi:hypothetical protein